MHNGGIAEFHKIKRRLQSMLPDDIFETVNGNTGMWSRSMCDKLFMLPRRFTMGVRSVLVQSMSNGISS